MPQIGEDTAPVSDLRDKKPRLLQFKLLAGLHVGRDYDQEPQPFKDDDGNVTHHHPGRTYKAGETVRAETDLAAAHGANKFQRLLTEGRNPEDTRPTPSTLNPAVPSPGGQVAQGLQRTVAGPDGVARAEAVLVDQVSDATRQAGRPPEPSVTPPHAAPVKAVQVVETPEPVAPHTLEEEYGNLDSLTVPELKELAAEERIDLRGSTTKRDILKTLREVTR